MKPLDELMRILEAHHRLHNVRPEADVPYLRHEMERIERAQSAEEESMLAAENAIEKLMPDGSAQTERRWREEQERFTAARKRLADLNLEETFLRSSIDCELWWARKRALTAVAA
ncbi:hypothetical protein D7X74_21225 [Corallococcus sp. CA047B]|uniref:hypothetical protein n=1 Tax=Corallococcus sp. CA047B TaxID=2316729 RepID=UPI000EA30878|nr:hypothetical protein [Corallococcus sp. CA047B]RKH13772.1 hypothetical protein D7X74_21225 [Corallococcus sp. CA047B]